MPRISRFRLRNSDRSGFKFFEIELVKDGPWKVAGEERDQPPPSRFSLGGEGDNAGDPRANGDFADGASTGTNTPTSLDNPTVFITAAGGITPSFVHPWMRVTGSAGNITISAVPNITRGREGQLLTLQCVDSAFTLTHGSANAINLMGSMGSVTIRSGGAITLWYSTANQAWNEASRTA